MSGPLERLLRPLEAGAEPGSRIIAHTGSGSASWLEHDGWRLYARCGEVNGRGAELAQFTTAGGKTLRARWDPDSREVHLPFDLTEAFENYVSEAWRADTRQRRLSERQLDVFYRLKRFIPRRAQLAARRSLARFQRQPEFPAWPLDRSVTRLLRFYARCLMLAAGRTEMPFRWFWPGGARAALVLTHDVESAEGLRLAVELADLEEERGLRSSFNVVARWYPIDRGIVRDLRERGFELGVHGVYHDRSMFASRESFESQLPVVRSMAAELGADGFRSPATHRVFEWLGELPVSYDCSVPHSDPFEPQPGGCCSLWPFFIGDVVELPYTMPQDHTLFNLLGHRSPEVWLRQLDSIEADHGLAQCVSHPDPGYMGDLDKRRLYAEFLEAVTGRDHLWRALPRDVASWWRARDGDPAPPQGAQGLARLGSADGEVVLDPPPAS